VQDLELFQAMREYWSSFVTTGVPTSSSANVDWDVSRELQSSLLIRILNLAIQPVSNTDDGSPRILLRPNGIRMEDITEQLDERCNFWHDNLGGQELPVADPDPEEPGGGSTSQVDGDARLGANYPLLALCVVVLMILY